MSNQQFNQSVDSTIKANQESHDVLRQAVQLFWVEGVLHHSLYNEVRIRLGLRQRTDAVDYPWDLILWQQDGPDIPIDGQTKLVDLYDQRDQRLLILGEPGSGKTTTLLMLAESLLARTKDDPTQPTPVLFNLSSWADDQPLDEWLVAELKRCYQRSEEAAQGWVDRNELILLLDGLDEVAANQQDGCITAINDFSQKHAVSIVLCSRTTDYDALTNRLELQGVVVALLTEKQIERYLFDLASDGQHLGQALAESDELRKLAKTPLMLNIMAVSYQESYPQPKETKRSQTETLFDRYIQQTLQHGVKEPPQYTARQILHWLRWLASQMVQHNQVLFFIQRLQIDWLGGQVQKNWYKLIIWLSPILIVWLIVGLFEGLFTGLFAGLFARLGFRKMLLGGVICVSIFGLIYGLFVDLFIELFGEPLVWSIFGGIGVLIGVLIVGLIGMRSFRSAGKAPTIETTLALETNQGFWQSFKNRLGGGLIVALIVTLIVTLFSGPATIGLVFGLILALVYILDTYPEHFLLRLFLYFQDQIPFNYAKFLDHAAEHLFLHKVGGGYIFVHRLIMEHIAALTDEDIERIVGDVEGR